MIDATLPLRVYVAGLAHETNSFSPLPTSLRSFEEDVCYRPGDPRGREAALGIAGYGDAVAVARAQGAVVVEGPCFWTQPSGPVTQALYTSLRDEILDGLRAAGPVDMVILNLHGAMMAQGLPDCEGDILTRMREVAGWDTPIGVLLDLHGNVSPQMVESGAIIVGVKEYPHVDYRRRAEELYSILCAVACGDIRPVTTLRTIPVLGLQGTTEEPMHGLVAALQAAEEKAAILSVTLMHGFPWSDWEQTGASVIVISDRASAREVEALADDLADRFLAIVSNSPVRRLDVARAIDEALATPPGCGPVIIADSSDNPGGGAACDSTFLLRELVERKVHDAALGMIWDPQAAAIAADAGVGTRLPLRVGGKVGKLSGDPIDLEVEVLSIRSDVRQRVYDEDPSSPLGLAVALRAGNVEFVVNSVRQQLFSPECFTELGIDVGSKALVVVKSSQHFRAHFDALARRTIYCAAPGSLSTDLPHLPYQHLQVLPAKGTFRSNRAVLWARSPNFRSIEPAVSR